MGTSEWITTKQWYLPDDNEYRAVDVQTQNLMKMKIPVSFSVQIDGSDPRKWADYIHHFDISD